MPRGIPNKKKASKLDTKNMSPAEYERTFGRKKPGPSVGFKRGKKGPKVKATAKAPARGKIKDGYFMPGRGKSKPVAAGLKKDGTPRKKPGPRPGAKREPKMTLVSTGRTSASKPNISNKPKASRDLGSPPVKFTLGVITQAALELKDKDLEILHARIEEKLAGDTSDFTKEDWSTVDELQASGYSRRAAIENVRKDKPSTHGETTMTATEETQPAQELTEPELGEIEPGPTSEEDDIEDDEEDEEDDGDDDAEEGEEEKASAVASPAR